MGALTETEIFDCLSDNFRKAAEHCENLAKLPRKGSSYTALRESLKLIEGACRQAAMWREDARWLRIGLMMAEAHERAGLWLRGIKLPSGQRVKIAEGHMHPLFMKLAEHLRSFHRKADEFKTQSTGRIGTILPAVQAAPHRDTRPVHISVPAHLRQTAGGIILPAGVTV